MPSLTPDDQMIFLDYYESCKFPGYYIHWHKNSTLVDCEVGLCQL